MKNKLCLIFAICLTGFLPVLSYAQTQVAPFLTPNQQFLDSSGNPLSGGKVCTFAAGSSTPLASYSESTGTTPNANPIVLDSSGRATIFLTSAAYKIIVAASTASSLCSPAITTADNVTWNNLAQTLSSLTVTGNVIIKPSAAATSGANQSSPTEELDGNYWTGAASALDRWLWQDVLSTGSNPTSTLTLSHSGSSGLPSVDMSAIAMKLSPYNIKGIYFVDGSKYTTVQAAFTDACAAGGGTVMIPPGTYAQNTPFVLCNNLTVIGAGSCQADAGTCPTTITTTITTSDLFPLVNINDTKISNIGVKNTGAGGGNAFRRFAAQRDRLSDIYISGPFAGGNWYTSSSLAGASTIWNTDNNIHCTGLQNGSVATKFDAADATNKVINGNKIWDDHCTAGTNGTALLFTNSNQQQQMNENLVECSECSAPSGVGIQFDQGATLDTVLIMPNSEGNSTCFSKATANSVTILGGHLQSCTTKVSDAQPAYTSFLGTVVQGVVPNFGVTPIGGAYFDSIGIGGGRPSSIAVDGFVGFNGASGYCFGVSAICNWEVQTSALVAHTDNATDIGLTGAKRPRHIYQAGKILEYNSLATVGNGVAASYGQDDKTAQSASVGSVTLITGAASTGGHYVLNYALYCTATDASGATVTLTAGWTSEAIARTSTSAAIGVNATTQQTNGAFPLNADNSTNITYSTTVTGVPTTGRYAVHVWVSKQ